jgi:murein DD-endopeptidase MepM/ murein hydrolase activator NlpD
MGKFGKHLGTDYATAIGTPVYSPVSGIVMETPRSSVVGTGIFIRENVNGRIHRLLHLNQEFVSPGQTVREGQHIAMSGNTGVTTGAHLHWDVRKANTTWDASFANYYDPEALLIPAPSNPTLAVGRYVYLKPTVSRWRFYPVGVKPQAGKEIATLNPAKFGGLTYQVLAVPFPSTATIQTQSFGRGNIFIDGDAIIQ